MKFCAQIRDLPVVSIEEGEELGKVQTPLIDPVKRSVAGFVLGTPRVEQGVRILPYSSVSSFGSFALTVGRASEVKDLVGEPYFLELFEKDVVLFGCRIVEPGGRLAGYVQDVGIDPQDGAIVLLKVTSDVGFMSPYRATIPYSSVEKIDGDTVTLKADEKVRFKKDLPGAPEEERTYVPLVLEEEDMRATLMSRLVDEMERIRRDVQGSLQAEYDRNFVARHRAGMETEIAESVSGVIEEAVRRNVDEARKAILNEIRSVLSSYAANEALDAERRGRETAIESVLETLDASLKKQAEAGAKTVSDLEASFIWRFTELESSVSRAVEKKFGELTAQLSENLAANRETLRAEHVEQLSGLERRVNEALGRAEKNLAGGAAEIEALKDRMSSVSLSMEIEGGKIRAELEKLILKTSEDMEKGLAAQSALREEMRNISETLESRLGEIETRTDASAASASEELRSLMQSAENVNARLMKMEEHAADAREELRSLKRSLEERIDAAEESAAALSVEVDGRINGLSARLESAGREQADYVAAKIAEILDVLNAADGKREEFEARLSGIEIERDAISFLSAGMDESEKKIEALEKKTKDTLDLALTRLASNEESLNSRIAAVEKLAGLLNERLETAKREAADNARAIENQKEQIEKLAGELLTEIGGRTERVRDEVMNAAVERMDAIAASAATGDEVRTLTRAVEDVRSRLREAEDRAAAKDEIHSLKRSLEERIDAAEESAAAHSVEVDGRINGLSARLESAGREQADYVAAKTAEILDALNAAGGKIEELGARLEGFEEERDGIKPLIQALEERVESLKTSSEEVLAERLAEIGTLPGEIAKARGEIASLKESLSRLERLSDEVAEMCARESPPRPAAGVEPEALAGALEKRLKDAIAELERKISSRAGEMEAALKPVLARLERRMCALEEKPVPPGVSPSEIERVRAELSELREEILSMTEPAPDAAPEKTALGEEELDLKLKGLETELEERIRASLTAGMEQLGDRVKSELFEEVKSGTWRDALREAQIKHLRSMTYEDADESGGAVTEQEAVERFGRSLVEKLMGKRVGRDIYVGSQAIIRKGQVVDEPLIETAKVHGKFLELSLSVTED
ncbi:MAG: hypothetical protein AB1742_07380 [bacterium]